METIKTEKMHISSGVVISFASANPISACLLLVLQYYTKNVLGSYQISIIPV